MLMRKYLSKGLYAAIYGYLILPFLIFSLGWLKIYIAIPIVLLLIICYFKICKESTEVWLPQMTQDNIIKILFIIGVIALWVYFSGIGKFVFQNTDHEARNGLFNILVTFDWPVVNYDVIQSKMPGVTKSGLVYYIGFWLPSALIGKVFGLRIGYYAQALWALIGISFVYYLICSKYRKILVWPLGILILFSGLDIVGMFLIGNNIFQIPNTEHLEWWSTAYQYSSMTTQLFWVFNQAIPAWLCTMLAISQKNNRNLVFILACCMLTSTFPFVGLLFIIVFLCLSRKYDINPVLSRKIKAKKYFSALIKDTFTFQNIIGGGIVGITSFLYLMSNRSGMTVLSKEIEPVMKNNLEKYIIFLVVEIGVYVILLYHYNKKNLLYYYIILLLILIPPIHVGLSNDFCMRASIPPLFILMLLFIDTTEKALQENNKAILGAVSIIVLIGSITPLHELARTVTYTNISVNQAEQVEEDDTSADILLSSDNFAGEAENNIFWDYFIR